MLSRKNGIEKVMEFMDDDICDCKWDMDEHLFHCSLLSTKKTGRPRKTVKKTPRRNTASEKPITIFSNLNCGKEVLLYFCSLTSSELIFKSLSAENTSYTVFMSLTSTI